MNRIEFHYIDGQSYTIKDMAIDGWVDWDKGYVRLIPIWGIDNYQVKAHKELIRDELLYILDRDKHTEVIHKNPKHKLSIKYDITTCKRRCKMNNGGDSWFGLYCYSGEPISSSPTVSTNEQGCIVFEDNKCPK